MAVPSRRHSLVLIGQTGSHDHPPNTPPNLWEEQDCGMQDLPLNPEGPAGLNPQRGMS